MNDNPVPGEVNWTEPAAEDALEAAIEVVAAAGFTLTKRSVPVVEDATEKRTAFCVCGHHRDEHDWGEDGVELDGECQRETCRCCQWNVAPAPLRDTEVQETHYVTDEQVEAAKLVCVAAGLTVAAPVPEGDGERPCDRVPEEIRREVYDAHGERRETRLATTTRPPMLGSVVSISDETITFQRSTDHQRLALLWTDLISASQAPASTEAKTEMLGGVRWHDRPSSSNTESEGR